MEETTDAAPTTEATTAATNGATTATDPPARTFTRMVYDGLPKGINRQILHALKPGKERQAYLNRYRKRHRMKPREVTITLPPPIARRPWLAADADAPASTANPPTTTKTDRTRKKHKNYWLKCCRQNTYLSLKPGRERQEFLTNYKKKHGLEVKPPPQKLVPTSFAWPKGMNREEFLAKNPGKDRMAYLARYIRKNGIELEETVAPVRPRVPVGRKPEPLAHPRCGCSSSEACASCSRCVELHCVCGLTGRRRRALCQESRACSCPLMDPTARCKLCHGCRKPHGLNHCRCVLHQRFLWKKRHPELDMQLTKEEEEAVCNCFVLAHRHGGAAATKEKEAKALKEIERVRRIKRATGFPSSDNIYRSKKITTFLGDEGLESDFDDGLNDGPGSEVLPPRTERVIPRTMTVKMLNSEFNPASYHPLFRSEGSSLLESIEPRGGRVSRNSYAAFTSDAMQGEICRGLENFAFILDRNAAMPPDDLVEFLVYMASIKASNVGELIGTFEDSAAIAASIVIEEYMAQLIEDHALQHQTLCPPTEANVQAFTRELLVGFNWQLFLQQNPCSSSETTDTVIALIDKEAALKDKLATLILHEFVSLQPRHFDVKYYSDDLTRWIRSAVAIPPFVLTSEAIWRSSPGATEDLIGKTSSPPENHQGNEAGAVEPAHQIRLSVKSNPVHGNPSYKLHFATTLEDGHRVETSVGGLDSKIKANATISQLSKAVQRQKQRSMGTLYDPPPAPGPPPVLHPPPPKDPNDPYTSMFVHVWEHFNDYVQQKWKASADMYFSATGPQQLRRIPTQETTAKRQTTGWPLNNPKKQKTASKSAEMKIMSSSVGHK